MEAVQLLDKAADVPVAVPPWFLVVDDPVVHVLGGAAGAVLRLWTSL